MCFKFKQSSEEGKKLCICSLSSQAKDLSHRMCKCQLFLCRSCTLGSHNTHHQYQVSHFEDIHLDTSSHKTLRNSSSGSKTCKTLAPHHKSDTSHHSFHTDSFPNFHKSHSNSYSHTTHSARTQTLASHTPCISFSSQGHTRHKSGCN